MSLPPNLNHPSAEAVSEALLHAGVSPRPRTDATNDPELHHSIAERIKPIAPPSLGGTMEPCRPTSTYSVKQPINHFVSGTQPIKQLAKSCFRYTAYQTTCFRYTTYQTTCFRYTAYQTTCFAVRGTKWRTLELVEPAARTLHFPKLSLPTLSTGCDTSATSPRAELTSWTTPR